MLSGQNYSMDGCGDSDSENGEIDGAKRLSGVQDKPLYDLQSQDKLEFKKFLRLQREGLINLKEIFVKM